MSTTKAGKVTFTAKKGSFLNMQQDGIKIRAGAFKNKKAYSRKDKSWKQD